MELEDEFQIEISDADAEKIQSVADAITCELYRGYARTNH